MQTRSTTRAMFVPGMAMLAPLVLVAIAAATPCAAAEPPAAAAALKEDPAPVVGAAPAPAALPSAHDLMRGALAPDAIKALIERRPEPCSAAERCRRVSFDTREHAVVNYLQAWRTRLGRAATGQVLTAKGNVPSAATTQLEIMMDAAGRVRGITVTATSGSELFDDAAIRSVRAAAPYPPLPPELQKDLDELHIDAHIRYTIGVGASLAHE